MRRQHDNSTLYGDQIKRRDLKSGGPIDRKRWGNDLEDRPSEKTVLTRRYHVAADEVNGSAMTWLVEWRYQRCGGRRAAVARALNALLVGRLSLPTTEVGSSLLARSRAEQRCRYRQD
jgi:hypothetical protein